MCVLHISMFLIVIVNRWGRGHPEEYTEAIAIGEENFDVDSDKKPRAGQILWIRGLTRLQTQVSGWFLPDTCDKCYSCSNCTRRCIIYVIEILRAVG